MAKITRKNMTVFGLNAGFEQIAQFGSLNASAPAFSTDVNTIISLANWGEGWFNAVEAVNSPAIEDVNAVDYVFGWQIAYMLQEGVAEWLATTTYYTGSLANDGTGNIYKSIADTNLNNALSNASFWQLPFGLDSSGNLQIYQYANKPTYFYTNSTLGGSLDGSQQWVIGTVAASPVTVHSIYGGLNLQNTNDFFIGHNGYIGSTNARSLNRYDTTKSGVVLGFASSTTATGNIYTVYANQPGDTSTTAAVSMLSFDADGQFIFGGTIAGTALSKFQSGGTTTVAISSVSSGATLEFIRTGTSTGGCAIQGNGGALFLFNGTTSNPIANQTMEIDSTAAFTFGNAGIMISSSYHKFLGSVLSDTSNNALTSGGFYGGKNSLELGANAYRTATGTITNLGGSGGVTLLTATSVTATSSNVLTLVAGTTGTTTSNLLTVRGDGLVSILAAGLLLPSGGDTLDYYNYSGNKIVAGSLTNHNGSGGISSVSVAGSYVARIGKIVHIQLQADFTMTTASGALQVALPFTAASSSRQIFQIPCFANNALAGAATGLVNFDTGTSTAYFLISATLAGANFNTLSDSTVGCNFWYECT